MGGFSFLDHTADVGIQATGADLKEAFANAAQGMMAWMTDLDRIEERDSRRVQAEAGDVEGLLVAFLNELNFIFETERFLFKRLEVLEIRPEPVEGLRPELAEGPAGVPPGEWAPGPSPGMAAEETHRLVALGHGEPFDPQRHEVHSQVKAATYHRLQVVAWDGGCRVQVILDI